MTRLKDLAAINRAALPETTDPDRRFCYIDISSVDQTGRIGELEELRFGDAPSRARRLVRQGDSIVSTVRTYLRAIAYIGAQEGDLVVSTGFATLTPRPDIHPSYLKWAVRSSEFIDEVAARSVGVSYPAITANELGAVAVPIRAIEDQRRVADYLDAETARIDEMIAECRQAALFADERFRASVLQDVHGSSEFTVALKHVASIADCKHRTPAYVDSGYPVVSPGDVVAGALDLGRCHRFVDEADWLDLTEAGRRPRTGDIVYSRNASVGLAGLVGEETGFCMGQDVCLIRTHRADGDGSFLTFVLNSDGLRQLDTLKIGSTFFRVNVADVATLRIPDLPDFEQDRFVSTWRKRLRCAAETTAEIGHQVALLQEHRQALITHAVTQGIDGLPGVA